jgi:hypothetical protein
VFEILREGTSPEGLPSNSHGCYRWRSLNAMSKTPKGSPKKNVCCRIDVGKGNPSGVGCTTALRYPPVLPVAIGKGGRSAAYVGFGAVSVRGSMGCLTASFVANNSSSAGCVAARSVNCCATGFVACFAAGVRVGFALRGEFRYLCHSPQCVSLHGLCWFCGVSAYVHEPGGLSL